MLNNLVKICIMSFWLVPITAKTITVDMMCSKSIEIFQLLNMLTFARTVTIKSSFVTHCHLSGPDAMVPMNPIVGQGGILGMGPASESRRYHIASPPIGWAHVQNYSW